MHVPFLDLKAMNSQADGDIQSAWRSVCETGEFIGGRFVEAFETAWAKYCDMPHCVGLSDGTAALELALRALGAGPGDDVLVPANTFVATWEAVVAVGARPIAVDVNPRTLLITADNLESSITPNTVGAIPVHLFGQPSDMTSIMAFARRRNIWILEDAAQAHGATWQGQKAGSFGNIGCFSFYPGKNLGAMGDAGAIVTASADLANKIRSMANHGRQKGSAHIHDQIGNNRRLDGLQAAILSAKLPYLDQWNLQRQAAMRDYQKKLADLPVKLVHDAPGSNSVYHLAVVQVDNRDAIRLSLTDHGIMTGVHYPTPCNLQPAYRHFKQAAMPVSELAATRILSLPMFPHISETQIDAVVDSLAKILAAQVQSRAGNIKNAAA